jgi:hypothetical protein
MTEYLAIIAMGVAVLAFIQNIILSRAVIRLKNRVCGTDYDPALDARQKMNTVVATVDKALPFGKPEEKKEEVKP